MERLEDLILSDRDYFVLFQYEILGLSAEGGSCILFVREWNESHCKSHSRSLKMCIYALAVGSQQQAEGVPTERCHWIGEACATRDEVGVGTARWCWQRQLCSPWARKGLAFSVINN